MNIKAAKRPISPMGSKVAGKAQAVPKSEQHKPLTESWTVNGETYQSTTELFEKMGNAENVDAVYSYTTQDAETPFSTKERLMNMTGDALLMGAGGAALGGLAGAGLTVLSAVGGVINAIGGGRMTSVGDGLLLIPVALGAGAGLVTGAVNGYRRAAPYREGGELSGKLSKSDDNAFFYPGGRVDKKVDLKQHEQATTPDVQPAKFGESKPFKNAALGAVGGAAGVGMSILGPVVLATPIAGATVGASLENRTTLGAGLGTAAGIATAAATLYGVNQAWGYPGANYLPLALLTGGMAVGGALLGDKVITGFESVPAQRDYGQQWWNANQTQ